MASFLCCSKFFRVPPQDGKEHEWMEPIKNSSTYHTVATEVNDAGKKKGSRSSFNWNKIRQEVERMGEERRAQEANDRWADLINNLHELKKVEANYPNRDCEVDHVNAAGEHKKVSFSAGSTSSDRDDPAPNDIRKITVSGGNVRGGSSGTVSEDQSQAGDADRVAETSSGPQTEDSAKTTAVAAAVEEGRPKGILRSNAYSGGSKGAAEGDAGGENDEPVYSLFPPKLVAYAPEQLKRGAHMKLGTFSTGQRKRHTLKQSLGVYNLEEGVTSGVHKLERSVTSGVNKRGGRFTMVPKMTKTMPTLEENRGEDHDVFRLNTLRTKIAAPKLKNNLGRISVAIPAMKNMLGNKTQVRSDKLKSPSPIDSDSPSITSIAVLRDGYFLTASNRDKVIRMFKQVPFGGDIDAKVEFVREFKGSKKTITALATLDRKGRFLSAEIDKTITLWDSRFNCEDDPDDEVETQQEPKVLLAKFALPDRWVHSIAVLGEGHYVRPTDNVDADMVAAIAKKTALEGTAAVQRAAIQREIIECSGSFATASKFSKNINVWVMTVVSKKEGENSDDVAQASLAHVLEHDASIKAMVATSHVIVTGDVMGNVWLWKLKRHWTFSSNSESWEKLSKFSTGPSIASYDKTLLRSITSLCILEGEGNEYVVSGSRNGKIRVWGVEKASKAYREIKHPITSVKITGESGSFSGIQQLPSFKDPNTGEDCLAFSVAATDGHVVSMAVYPQAHDVTIFHAYDHSRQYKFKENVINHSISAITSDNQVLIVGDGTGDIHFLRPEWSPDEQGLSEV